jgi:multicomponent Na+:H+ antiporter subunit B
VSPRARLAVLAVGLAGFGFLLVWGMTGLPDFGHYPGPYGIVLQNVGVEQRKATDLVSSTTFDYRGFDTMIEEFILFAAATGLVVLLRAQRGEERDREEAEDHPADRRRQDTSDALRAVAVPAVGAIVVLGAYVITHGHLTPGGGFQGGVILAAVPILIYLAGQALLERRLSPLSAVEVVEAAGAAGFVCIGVGGLIAGVAFLYNFVPLGTPGDLLSAGTIPLLNLSVGIEVAGAVTLTFSEFLDQRLLHAVGGE